MRRFPAQLILLLATLIVAHAQCVLACAVDNCRQTSVPPCHKHHPAKTIGCNQDQFVGVAHAPVWTLTLDATAAIPAAEAVPERTPSQPAVTHPTSPPLSLSPIAPIRI
jgi:hypothetical protein